MLVKMSGQFPCLGPVPAVDLEVDAEVSSMPVSH